MTKEELKQLINTKCLISGNGDKDCTGGYLTNILNALCDNFESGGAMAEGIYDPIEENIQIKEEDCLRLINAFTKGSPAIVHISFHELDGGEEIGYGSVVFVPGGSATPTEMTVSIGGNAYVHVVAI